MGQVYCQQRQCDNKPNKYGESPVNFFHLPSKRFGFEALSPARHRSLLQEMASWYVGNYLPLVYIDETEADMFHHKEFFFDMTVQRR